MSFSKPKTCKYIVTLFKHQTFAKILFPHAHVHEITKPKSAVHSPVTKVKKMMRTHCVLLYLIHFEEDASYFLIFWSTHMSQNGERKQLKSYDGHQR